MNEYVEAVETAEEQENVGGTAADVADSGDIDNDEGTETTDGSAEAEGREFTDEEGEDGGKGTAEEDDQPEAPEKANKPEQTPEERRENARRRREAEEAAKIKAATAKARVDAILEVTGGVNPYTNKPMKDAQDVAVYEVMRRIEKSGGDPVRDYADTVAEDTRKAEATRVSAEADKKWYRDDMQAFVDKHPDVDAEALLRDPTFNKFAAPQVKVKVPLSEIYEAYEGLKAELSKGADDRVKEAETKAAEADKKAKDEAARALANARAGVGAKSGETAPTGDPFFTKAQVEAMSDAERDRNMDAIWESMKKW